MLIRVSMRVRGPHLVFQQMLADICNKSHGKSGDGSGWHETSLISICFFALGNTLNCQVVVPRLAVNLAFILLLTSPQTLIL